MKRIAVLGATSAIAVEAARVWATSGAELFLAARDGAKVEAVAADLKVRGAGRVETYTADLADRSTHGAVWSEAERVLGESIDVVLVAYGVLPDQAAIQNDPEKVAAALNVNFVSTAALLTAIAAKLEARGRGTLAVIASVAGDRGRKSNYIYGSAKGGLGLFLGGLRNRLAAQGIHVVTINPGFVDTPMTAHLPKGPLFASSRTVGRAIVRAVDRGADIAYVPWFWRPIMLVIRSIPERIFKRLSL